MSSIKGSKLSEEHKRKIGEGNTGKKASPETKEKLRQSHLGYKHTDEQKEKNRLAHLGKKHPMSEETKRKIVEANKGFKHTEESKIKIGLAEIGDKHHNWKGGKAKFMGYLFIYKPEHPNCINNRYIFEHRLVMEESIGRFLTKKEVVHHINEIKDDNRIENLMLFANISEHMKYHNEQNRLAMVVSI